MRRALLWGVVLPLVIVLAILLLFALMGLPVWSLYSSSNTAGKLVSAAIDIIVVLLMGDLLWVWAKTLIDRRMADYEAPAHGQMPGPGARMATLLPLFRKIVFTVIAIMVVLVVLSSLGVNIAPLIAGAGVVGIAIGFGAQALVKDIVSGVFFLLEDAFRVGEYIEMGDLRGTVESISVRSLRLRHHLGAIHTIPYGELASLTNHSRDWAIIKMEFRVPFETDLKLVKKIVKKIGAELQQNEDYGHHIIEPLKSQGVRRMEEFNMVVGVKFMSAPGQQWTIRRDAYQAMRDAFDKNGLSFAERSVKVEVVGDGGVNRDVIAGAAQDAIESRLDNKPPVIDDTP
jgi:small-conductance mechanosensitive channel